MSNGQITVDIHLTFPTEKMREDFEIAFQAFVKNFQKQQTIYYSLRGIAAGQLGGTQGGGQGEGQGQGLFRIRTASGSAYLNFF